MKLLYLETLHQELGAKMGEFAGYNMPLTYKTGLIDEHLHTRNKAGVFDISHMGQFSIKGNEASKYLNRLLPIYCHNLNIGQSKYTLLLNEHGCIIDDVIVTKIDDTSFGVVVNAACLEKNYAHFLTHLKEFKEVSLEYLENKVLFALQGPKAADVLISVTKVHALNQLGFMEGMSCQFTIDSKNNKAPCKAWINRNGYTGEDGFEISLDNEYAEVMFSALINNPEVLPIGLGARNSLRLEAGLCLYGHDIDQHTNPFEAKLTFAISKKRLQDAEDNIEFIGKLALQKIAEDAASNILKKVRIGILSQGKAPIREGVLLYDTENINPTEGNNIGRICSGSFAPSLEKPIAMAYVKPEYAAPNTELWANLRGRMISVQVTSTKPFVEHNYKK